MLLDTVLVVVVEDEESIRHMLSEVLALEGFSVVEVAEPTTVYTELTDMQPNIFLVDLMLPGTNGIALAESLRENGYAATPMIAMSASALMRRAALQSGFFAHTIEKPFDIQTVLDCIQRHVM
ncbi:MAG: hypothetical protein NVS2B16_05170 [Chloroflexota bacterium]